MLSFTPGVRIVVASPDEVKPYRGRARDRVKQYSAERKEALLRQMMPPQNRLVSELARESGITEQTLYTWRRQLRSQGMPVPGSGKNAEEWSSEDKFAVVLETAALNATELAEYCFTRFLLPVPGRFLLLQVTRQLF